MKKEEVSYLEKGYSYLELKKWKEAIKEFDLSIVNKESKAEAYMGRVLAKLKLSSLEDLEKCKKSFYKDSDFKYALKYADEEYKKQLEEYEKNNKRYSKYRKDKRIIFSVILCIVLILAVIVTFFAYPNLKFQMQYNKIKNAKVGDVVKFGTYEQDANKKNGKEPIEWMVSEVDLVRDKVLLLSEYALDTIKYYDDYEYAYNVGINWENSYARRWLNDVFFKESFTKEERGKIILSDINNYDYCESCAYEVNWIEHKYDKNITKDYVFIFSDNEVERIFRFNEARLLKATPYAIKKGANHEREYVEWWLRNHYVGCRQKTVSIDGKITKTSACFDDTGIAIRPAMWIDISK